MNCEYCCGVMPRGKTDTNCEHKTMFMSGNVDMMCERHRDIVDEGIVEGYRLVVIIKYFIDECRDIIVKLQVVMFDAFHL